MDAKIVKVTTKKSLITLERERERWMGSSYTWCNSIRVTPFLGRRFPKDRMVKNKTLLSITSIKYLTN